MEVNGRQSNFIDSTKSKAHDTSQRHTALRVDSPKLQVNIQTGDDKMVCLCCRKVQFYLNHRIYPQHGKCYVI